MQKLCAKVCKSHTQHWQCATHPPRWMHMPLKQPVGVCVIWAPASPRPLKFWHTQTCTFRTAQRLCSAEQSGVASCAGCMQARRWRCGAAPPVTEAAPGAAC